MSNQHAPSSDKKSLFVCKRYVFVHKVRSLHTCHINTQQVQIKRVYLFLKGMYVQSGALLTTKEESICQSNMKPKVQKKNIYSFVNGLYLFSKVRSLKRYWFIHVKQNEPSKY